MTEDDDDHLPPVGTQYWIEIKTTVNSVDENMFMKGRQWELAETLTHHLDEPHPKTAYMIIRVERVKTTPTFGAFLIDPCRLYRTGELRITPTKELVISQFTQREVQIGE
ncbi:hypothetical protein HDV00_002784 [Rhizophlyctis rosea]|nr:hypothetical protein HDV00_002784 [Rhizophlyctis rosea]